MLFLESLVEEQALPERVSQVGGTARERKESADLRFGVLERLIGETVGEVYLPPTPLRSGASHRRDPETSIRLV